MSSAQEIVRPSRGAAEARYRTIRLAALHAAEALAASAFTMPVRLTGIGPEALDIAHYDWAVHPNRRCQWPWREMIADFPAPNPPSSRLRSGPMTFCAAWPSAGLARITAAWTIWKPRPRRTP